MARSWNGITLKLESIKTKAQTEGSIRYGKNIIGISEKLNCDNVATRIYPVGMDGITLPEKYLLNHNGRTLIILTLPLLNCRVQRQTVKDCCDWKHKSIRMQFSSDVNYKSISSYWDKRRNIKTIETWSTLKLETLSQLSTAFSGLISVKVISIERYFECKKYSGGTRTTT